MTNLIELITIRDFLRWTISRFNEACLFYGHGTDNAWDEALALILHTLHLPHDLNPAMLDARLTAIEREALFQLIQQRIHDRIPLAYLIKEAWFAHLAFYVDQRVLIPRSPIAELIENHFQPWVNPDEINSILDLCTGSGCIAIACAKYFPEATVDAVDISSDALAVAKMNVEKHQVTESVQLHQSDLFHAIPGKKYDVIVSNPPYVDATDMANLPAEYHHEPKLGLEAGVLGLDIALQILRHAAEYLHPQGILIVEVGNSEQALIDLLSEIPFTWLEFQRGGGGVFLLTAEQLHECKNLLMNS